MAWCFGDLQMKDLPLKLLGCFVICLVLAANPSNALQSCKESPTTKVGTFLKWTDCVGTWSNNVVKITAEMKNGQANGFGTWDHARGDKYIGMFQNSLQHGPGIMYYTNGEVDEGTWKSGKFQYKHSTSYSRKPSTSSALKAEFKKTSLSARTKVQENLKKLGLYKSSIDGLYGQGTERALKAYNSKYFNEYDILKKEISKNELSRFLFYKKNATSLKSILCFANVPPPLKIKSKTFIYFHNEILLDSKNLDFSEIKQLFFKLKWEYIKSRNSSYTWFVQTQHMKELLLRKLNKTENDVEVNPIFQDLIE